MFLNIIAIALLCIAIGGASIPISFTINSNPLVVWLGNALGSIISAIVVIYIANRITNDKFKKKVSKHHVGKKVVEAFDESEDSKKVKKTRGFINRHGLKVFSLLCPIFPGVLVSTAIVYGLNLDKTTYKRWLMAGVFFVSGGYVLSYWWVFVRT